MTADLHLASSVTLFGGSQLLNEQTETPPNPGLPVLPPPQEAHEESRNPERLSLPAGGETGRQVGSEARTAAPGAGQGDGALNGGGRGPTHSCCPKGDPCGAREIRASFRDPNWSIGN